MNFASAFVNFTSVNVNPLVFWKILSILFSSVIAAGKLIFFPRIFRLLAQIVRHSFLRRVQSLAEEYALKPAPFEYVAATSVEETGDLLARSGDDAEILAEGQSLVPLLALRLAHPTVLIDMNPVRGLDYVQAHSAGLSAGARTRLRSIERPQAVREQFPLLLAGVGWIGHSKIRNRGAVGGSLALADLGVWEIL
jgi:xanthine dehydrogenase iron-sulfur cluster and FAD-binding subunit A